MTVFAGLCRECLRRALVPRQCCSGYQKGRAALGNDELSFTASRCGKCYYMSFLGPDLGASLFCPGCASGLTVPGSWSTLLRWQRSVFPRPSLLAWPFVPAFAESGFRSQFRSACTTTRLPSWPVGPWDASQASPALPAPAQTRSHQPLEVEPGLAATVLRLITEMQTEQELLSPGPW